jgi:HD-GYP domain-containing protein (c-di-GMP phosphodiesterase class II)
MDTIRLSLEQVPLFSSLPPGDIELLKNTLQEIDVPEGTLIIREHERGNSLFIILEGQVEIIKALGTEDEHVMVVEGTGSLIGEMSLINRDSMRTASVRTQGKTRLVEMSHVDFESLLTRSPSLAIEIMRILSSRLREVDNATIRELQQTNIKITKAYDMTLEGWAKALELRDNVTAGHTHRVTEMTNRLAIRMGIKGQDLIHLRRGAMLHDIGKMGVPDGILLKPGPLSDDEWKIMRMHPQHAQEMLSSIEFLAQASDIPYCHHEKWDGSGYPRGMKGEDIPLGARIFAVVDVWDALTQDRPYRKAWAKEEVIDHIRAISGTHFDPKVVEEFTKIYLDEKPH